MMRFVVVSRAGIQPDPNVSWYLNTPHLYAQAEGEIDDTSSSEVRAALLSCGADRGVLRNMLDDKVLRYIEDHRFYREEK